MLLFLWFIECSAVTLPAVHPSASNRTLGSKDCCWDVCLWQPENPCCGCLPTQCLACPPEMVCSSLTYLGTNTYACTNDMTTDHVRPTRYLQCIQACSNWCWAADSGSILNYLGIPRPCGDLECEAASALRGLDCCLSKCTDQCNLPATILDISSTLNKLGAPYSLSFTWHLWFLSLDDLLTNSLSYRPVLVGVSSDLASSSSPELAGVGHAVVVVGCRLVLLADGGIWQLLVADPAKGSTQWMTYTELQQYLSPYGSIIGTVTFDG